MKQSRSSSRSSGRGGGGFPKPRKANGKAITADLLLPAAVESRRRASRWEHLNGPVQSVSQRDLPWVARDAGSHLARDVCVAETACRIGKRHRAAGARESERSRTPEVPGGIGLHEAERIGCLAFHALIEEPIGGRDRRRRELLQRFRPHVQL